MKQNSHGGKETCTYANLLILQEILIRQATDYWSRFERRLLKQNSHGGKEIQGTHLKLTDGSGSELREWREGDLYICEDSGNPLKAYRWIGQRVARMEQLAQRILDYIPEERHFVTPTGTLLDDIDKDPDEKERYEEDAICSIENILAPQPAGVTSILYLTSDAGEGKTTTINQLSRMKALEFQKKQSSWLLVPIALAGRPFMRFDDIVVAEMSNRYRFMTYFDAFIELVRLNMVIPALDGFEEVFEESSSGEGASSLGGLIGKLNGGGRVVVAARKAYFEIKSFAAQAKLYDSFDTGGAVNFSRLSLNRWSKDQFIDYTKKCQLPNGHELYRSVSDRLGPKHPLLTRAVLAGKLVSVASEGSVSELLGRLGQHPEDYFYQFVNSIIEREADTKWIDRSGNSASAEPLLTVDEHHELLASIAREMWITGVDSLKEDVIEVIAEVFSEEHRKSPSVGLQVRRRIHQHSLLVSSGQTRKEITFDHEDFKLFYLGQVLASEMATKIPGLETFLGAALLSVRSVDAATQSLRRDQADLFEISEKIKDIGELRSNTSYKNVNAAAIYLTIRDGLRSQKISTVRNLVFPVDALCNKKLERINFEKCHFPRTSIGGVKFNEINFNQCTFERIEINDCEISNCRVDDCKITSVVDLRGDSQDQLFSPQDISSALTSIGFDLDIGEVTQQEENPDAKTKLACQALRTFMRSTHINENVFKVKMGTDANIFLEEVLPDLVKSGIVEEVVYAGAGQQSRYKLNVAMKKIENAILKAKSLPELTHELKGESVI